MGSRRRPALGAAVLLFGFFIPRYLVSGFAVKARAPTVRPLVIGPPHSATTSALGAGKATTSNDFGSIIGVKIASALVNSPLYPFLVIQAKDMMKQCAENIGIDWDREVARLREAKDWDAALQDLLATSSVKVPGYYRQPFHAYRDGNLCWDAAFEQQLASKSVGVRNFPNDAKNGERLLRKAYEKQMDRLGVVVDDGGLVVDMGCGTGRSTRSLAEQFPGAGRIVGFDLSPHMVLVGRFLAREDEAADPRVELSYGAAEKTGLPDGRASLVSLCLVVHELSSDARRQIFREACRILRPGGSLSIMEMDPSSPGLVKVKNNLFLFSILRSTEPYLDVYFGEAEEVDAELQEAGFSTVRKSGATERHVTIVAVKGGTLDLRRTDEEREKADTQNPIQKETGNA